MDKWRSIDYERRLKRELDILNRSNISEKNKKLILKYKNHRLARGVSIARVHRDAIVKAVVRAIRYRAGRNRRVPSS